MRRIASSLCCAVSLCVVGPPATAEDTTSPRYSLKQEDPDTGSHIIRDVTSASRVQIDKSFAELSAPEQAFWKSQYEDLGPNDVPPFPAHGLKTLYKAMAAVQRKHQARGKLAMLVQVDKSGRATSVSVITSPDPLLTRDVATILMLAEYTPGTCAGVPCAMDFPFRISFTLR